MTIWIHIYTATTGIGMKKRVYERLESQSTQRPIAADTAARDSREPACCTDTSESKQARDKSALQHIT